MALGTVPGAVPGLFESANIMSIDRRELFESELSSFIQKHNVPVDQQMVIKNQFEQEFSYLHTHNGQLCYKFIEDSQESFYPFGGQSCYSGSTIQYSLMLRKVKSPLSWGPPDYLNWDDRVPYNDPTTIGAITGVAKADATQALA